MMTAVAFVIIATKEKNSLAISSSLVPALISLKKQQLLFSSSSFHLNTSSSSWWSSFFSTAASAASPSPSSSLSQRKQQEERQQRPITLSEQQQQQQRRKRQKQQKQVAVVEQQRPPNPDSLITSDDDLNEHVNKLVNWFHNKKNVLCITGAGISTESGIPDYRGYNGSYHKGHHKPMIHDQFIKSSYHRSRYYSRGMMGWKYFHERKPNLGHIALAELEKMGKIGVQFDDQPNFYDDENDENSADHDHHVQQKRGRRSSSRKRSLSIITQNVDRLHYKAGSQNVLELHGRTDILKCMNCGHILDRNTFHTKLEELNSNWLSRYTTNTTTISNSTTSTGTNDESISSSSSSKLRPDGDSAALRDDADYNTFIVPDCNHCSSSSSSSSSFYKPDVVFFGDNVPRSRVMICQTAIQQMNATTDGIFVIGTSLMVHSIYRHVRTAFIDYQIPIAILNVGRTRIEAEYIDEDNNNNDNNYNNNYNNNNLICKVEAPAGRTLSALVKAFKRMEGSSR